jgi:iron complex outermembrane recepter protein
MKASKTQLRQAVNLILASFAASTAQYAVGQTAPTAPSTAAAEEVVVTGSRLTQSPNDVSIAPVTSITALDVQQTGLTRTEDLLNNLPQVIAENSSGQSISSNGTATVSLRGLGSQRTLVLINGRRMAPGAGLGLASSPDINQIPADLIERTDVLTGGASAVYGADAVAGVVNFVLNTKFTGVKVDANYSYGSHSNNAKGPLAALAAAGDPQPDAHVNLGASRDVSILVGSNFADNKGNATAYFTFLNQAPVVGTQLDYAGCTLNTPGSAPKAPSTTWTNYACGGSSTSATGRFLELGQVSGTSTVIGNGTVAGSKGFRNYSSATDAYNYGGLSYIQRQGVRYTAGGFINYDVNDHINVYSETMFARNESTAQYGASGLFAFGKEVIDCANNPLFAANTAAVAALCSPTQIAENQANFNVAPYGPNHQGYGLTGKQILLYIGRRSVESGPRLDNYSSTSIRQVVGSKGRIDDVWTYDIYGSLGISQMLDVEGGFLGTQQIDRVLNVVKDPQTGNPVCYAALTGIDTACVPWNIWTPNGVTQAQLNYLTVQSSYTVKAAEYIGSGYVAGDLGKYGWRVPTAANGVNVSLGAEYRQENYDFNPDYIFANGYDAGGNGKFSAIHGGFHVGEVFTEFRVPLADDKPGAYLLNLDGGYRYSNYTTGFSTNTYKLGLEWAPIQDLRVRGGYNRAVRAPNIGDLLTPAVIGSGGTADPCWSSTPSYTLAQCERTGVTAAQYGHILANPAAQINTSGAGNPNLTPEVADTYTLGIVIQPQTVPGLVYSFDYYDIKIKNTIASLSSNSVLAACATGSAEDQKTFCPLIHRGTSGSLWFNNDNYIDTYERNIGQVVTKGVDIAAHYALGLSEYGKMNLSFTGTEYLKASTQPLNDGAAYDCVGYFGTTCGAPTPKWRHVLNDTWQTPWAGMDLTLRWRFIGATNTDRSSPDPQLNQTFFPASAHIPNYSYLDMSWSMPVTSWATVRVGINNIADKSPPLVLNGNYSDCPNSTCNDNTWVGTYDTLGRFIYAHIGAKF